MIRRLVFGLIVLAIIVLVGSQAALWYGRSLFAEPDVPVANSVTEALNARRIVLVFAHPDDEITATELISRAVDEGAFVATITATRGEAGTQFPEIVDQAHLGVVREGELRRHGYALGLDEQIVLGLPDGGVPDAMSDAQALQRPDAVAGVLSGRLFAAIFLTPLLVYFVSFLTHLIARPFGGQGDFWSARVALVWALVVAIPLVLLGGLVQAVAGASGLPSLSLAAGAVSFATALGFLWIWAQFLAVAEGIHSARRIFAIFLTIIALIAAPYLF